MDKTQRAAVFKSFLSRDGPQSLGTTEWPAAKTGALKGKKLLSTGILETIEREALNQLLVACSGHVMSTISKKLDILIVGRDAGPTKLQKADEWGLTQMGEQEFYEFLKKTLDNFTEQDGGDEQEPAAAAPKKKAAAKRSQKKTGQPAGDGADGEEGAEPVQKEKPAKKAKK